MPPPSRTPGADNPYARPTAWGRPAGAPFRLGVGPGSARLSGGTPTPPPPSPRGAGILGRSPLQPDGRSPLAAGPAPSPRPTEDADVGPVAPPPVGPAVVPAPQAVRPRAVAAPRTLRLERRLALAGAGLGLVALVVAALIGPGRRAAPAAPPAPAAAPTAVAPPAVAVPAVERPAPTDDARPVLARPTARAVVPAPASRTVRPAPALRESAARTPAPAEVPAIAPPTLPPPAPVALAPATPPPAAVRPPADPDAPFVLRRGED